MKYEHTAKLLLRLTCGGMLFLHGWHKVFVEIESVKQMVQNAGLPAFFAYGSVLGEFVAPVFMIVGWKTRIAALVIAFNMLASVLIAHSDIIFTVNDYGAWSVELNIFYMMTALCIALLGAGSYSISKGRGAWD